MEFIQQNLLLVLMALGSGGALIAMSMRRPGGRSGVTPTQATLLINREDAQVIDVRGSDEYVVGICSTRSPGSAGSPPTSTKASTTG